MIGESQPRAGMMRDRSPTVKLSLVFPVLDHRRTLLERAQDLVSFWSRFPVDVEILFSADPHPALSPGELGEDLDRLGHASRVSFRLLAHAKRRGRGASVQAGLEAATGEVLGVNSLDLAIPLAETFAGLQEFVMNRDQSFLLLGNRRGTKKKRKPVKRGLRAFFEGVEHEKSASLGVSDPTSPFWMIKKSDWERLGIQNLRPWFYTPQVILAARRVGLPVREIEVQAHEDEKSALRLWDALR